MSQPAVLVEGLEKTYKGGTRAVDGIDFSVSAGEFFGFLGPNGAGKTTTIKVLATLLPKSAGRAVVAGYDVTRDPKAVRRSIGFAMQEVGLDDLSTGQNFLFLQGVLYGMSRADARRRAQELLELVGLSAVAKRRVGTYSGGMRRRIDLAGALMHNPRILFLDEPTTGLDPQSRLAIWDHLRQLNEQGVTILLTTQLMEEADRLCGRIAIIDNGRIVAAGSPGSLKSQVGGDVVHVRLGADDDRNGRRAAAESALAELAWVKSVTATADGVSVQVQDGNSAAPEIMRLLHGRAIPVATLAVASPTLDDVFLRHTGRQIRDAEATGDEERRLWGPWLGVNTE